MLRGMYDFNPVDEKTLGFRANERLLYLGTRHLDNNWLKASNAFGRVGLVPVNYVKIDHDYTGEIVLEFLNGAIRKSQHDKDSRIDELLRLRDRIIVPSRDIKDQIIDLEDEIRRTRQIAISELGNVDKSYVPMDEIVQSRHECRRVQSLGSVINSASVASASDSVTSASVASASASTSAINVINSAPASSVNIIAASSSVSEQSHSQSRSDFPQRNDSRLAGKMVDGVRNSTGMSHELSQIAVQTVIEFLQQNFTEISGSLDSLLSYLETPSAISRFPDIVQASPDASKLKRLFSILTECKNDEQQRSWAVHEDESMIIDSLKDLHTILVNADPSISIYVMKDNHYMNVHALVLYYQMETRKSIRQLLRECFTAICVIDKHALSALANSILPMDLAREIQECSRDVNRLYGIANLLAFLMCPGEALPITHYEYLGSDFVVTVLRTIEKPPDDDEIVCDKFVNLLLAYNLQFREIDHNFTIQALSEMRSAPQFSQKIINLLNWGKDPVVDELVHCPPETDSVFKLLMDIFSNLKTAKLFYTNDVKVLIDIIIRCLTDLGPGDKKRHMFLSLIRQILRNTPYCEHQHRNQDLSECLTRILLEDDDSSSGPCHRIIKDMYLEFPILKIK